jgi:hypothetical protein
MTLVLLVAGGWIALSLAVMPLMARMFRPHPACHTGLMQHCPDRAACAAAGRCLATAHDRALASNTTNPPQ